MDVFNFVKNLRQIFDEIDASLEPSCILMHSPTAEEVLANEYSANKCESPLGSFTSTSDSEMDSSEGATS